MFTLIKGAQVYAPKHLGKVDVLFAGTQVLAIEPNITLDSNLHFDTINAQGMILTPGFVDSLVHITGGGGEAGFASRTPEMQLTDASTSGITTVVAALGTDSSSRSLHNLIAKAKGLKEEGLNVFCHSGSYHLPAKTLTDSLTNDIMYIDEFIGVGEVAIADHRSSQPTMQQLAEVASQSRVAGMLSGKSGTVSIHIGPSKEGLELLFEVADKTDIPIKQFYPTHMNRNSDLVMQGIKFCKQGGVIDFTTSTTDHDLAHGELAAAEALAFCLSHGVNDTQLTMSSDGHASLPIFNEENELIGMDIGKESSLLDSFVQAVQVFNVSIEQALMSITSNPAKVLGLDKGTLKVGGDADLILIDEKSLIPQEVWSNGKHLVSKQQAISKGMFEHISR